MDVSCVLMGALYFGKCLLFVSHKYTHCSLFIWRGLLEHHPYLIITSMLLHFQYLWVEIEIKYISLKKLDRLCSAPPLYVFMRAFKVETEL